MIVDDGVDPVAAELIADYLRSRPDLADAIRAAGACVVVFGAQFIEPGRFVTDMQAALDRAGAALPPGARPLFVGRCVMSEIVDELDGDPTRVELVQLRPPRGVVVGYIAFGEGGLRFFDRRGRCHGVRPRDEDVLEAVRSIV